MPTVFSHLLPWKAASFFDLESVLFWVKKPLAKHAARGAAVWLFVRVAETTADQSAEHARQKSPQAPQQAFPQWS